MAWLRSSKRSAAAESHSTDSITGISTSISPGTSSIDPSIETAPTSGSLTDVDALDCPGQTPIAADFTSLPSEIHLAISKLLIYPDALSLKHTNRHFYGLVDTGVQLKVEWLMQRRKLHLECPNSHKCELQSDLRFCRGSVPLLMKRRREHMECDSRPGVGCLVFGTKTCVHRKRYSRWRRWMSLKFTIELWWVLLALIPIVLFSSWLVELLRSGSHYVPA